MRHAKYFDFSHIKNASLLIFFISLFFSLFPMRHILSSKQFSRADIDYLMSEARKMDTILSK